MTIRRFRYEEARSRDTSGIEIQFAGDNRCGGWNFNGNGDLIVGRHHNR